MKNIYIPIHSFVDLITNSSSEIFVSDTENTVTALKEAIDSLLKLIKSDKTCNDLFDVKLAYAKGIDVSSLIEEIEGRINDENDDGDFDFTNKDTDENLLAIFSETDYDAKVLLELHKSIGGSSWNFSLNRDVEVSSDLGKFISNQSEDYESRPIETSAVLIPKIDHPDAEAVAKAFGKITSTISAEERSNY